MVGWLIIARARAIINRDFDHVEVAKRLQDSDFERADLMLLVTGDGAGEFSLFCLLIFSLWTVNLPSMRQAPLAIRQAVQTKVMLYVSACALFTFWIFFPESNYYSPDTLPASPTMASSGELNPVMVILVSLMVAFSGELFAITSLQHHGDYFATLKPRALIKTYAVAGIILIGLYHGGKLEINFITDQVNNSTIATIILLSQALVLAFVCVPAKRTDGLLKVGQARTKSFAVMSTLALLVLLIVTSIGLQATDEYASGNRYLHESLWLTASFLIVLSVVQLLPRYGFDSAARPEYWWLRITIVFAPALIYWFNPLAIFMIPGLWIIASLSAVLPNLIELDAQSPSKLGVWMLAIVYLVSIFSTSATTNMLGNFILIGSIILICTSVVSNSIKY